MLGAVLGAHLTQVQTGEGVTTTCGAREWIWTHLFKKSQILPNERTIFPKAFISVTNGPRSLSHV